jgi:hypothetical protein
MKYSLITLSLLVAVNVSGLAFAKTSTQKLSKKRIEKVLTNKKEALTDPYYKLQNASVRELSAEEALQFELDDQATTIFGTSDSKQNIITKGANIKIPGGVPGMDTGFSSGSSSKDSSTTLKGGSQATELAVGTGTGGTAQTTSGITSVAGVLDGVILIVDKLIAIGQKIIPTIEKGKAVVTNKPMTAISVLPRLDGTDPVVHDMADWSIPTTKHYKITYSNGLGMEVVSFVYSVTFQYGGTYVGKGQYLAGVRMAARDIVVDWGFDLDASSSLIQISNVGSATNVVAGATLEMNYTVKNWTRTLSTSEYFHVTGAGKVFKLD